ncbi:MAG: hypothetical protein HQ580_01145 [Planctomycetes bacterium]|jgi:hypothetical protein|nr:hypothetical protein [Planctomycetota bacterium]
MTTEKENKSCQLLSAKELAKMLSLSKRQIHRLNSCHRLPAPQDTDQDGMDDKWEKQNQLNPKDPADRNGDRNNDGYTNLEEYINSITSI